METNYNIVNHLDYIEVFGRNDEVVPITAVKSFLNKYTASTERKVPVHVVNIKLAWDTIDYLCSLGALIKEHGLKSVIILREYNISLLNYVINNFDDVQVYISKISDAKKLLKHKDDLTLILPGTRRSTYFQFIRFVNKCDSFKYLIINMERNEKNKEKCRNRRIWKYLKQEDHNWVIVGNRQWCVYDNITFKRAIEGLEGIVPEWTIPKNYPNGNYNKDIKTD